MLTRQRLPQMGLTLLLIATSVAAQSSSTEEEAAKYGVSVERYLLLVRMIKAHGVLMGIAFAFMFPMGAILIRLCAGRPWALKLHVGWQLFAWLLTLGGFGTGVWLVDAEDEWYNVTRHSIIGTVVSCIVILMPALGYAHHIVFTKKGYRTLFTYLHIWLGRLTLVLGGINGGLGIWFYHDIPFYSIYAYSIVAGVFYLGWFATSIYYNIKGPIPFMQRSSDDTEKGEMRGLRGASVDYSVGKDLSNMKEIHVQETANNPTSPTDSLSSVSEFKSIEASTREYSKDSNRFPFSNRHR